MTVVRLDLGVGRRLLDMELGAHPFDRTLHDNPAGMRPYPTRLWRELEIVWHVIVHAHVHDYTTVHPVNAATFLNS